MALLPCNKGEEKKSPIGWTNDDDHNDALPQHECFRCNRGICRKGGGEGYGVEGSEESEDKTTAYNRCSTWTIRKEK